MAGRGGEGRPDAGRGGPAGEGMGVQLRSGTIGKGEVA